MAKFYDRSGEVWWVNFDDDSLARLREQEGITSADICSPAFWGGDDQERTVRIIYILLEPQIVARGLTPESFLLSVPTRCMGRIEKAMLAAADERFKPGQGSGRAAPGIGRGVDAVRQAVFVRN
jgi:hypothetical protein